LQIDDRLETESIHVLTWLTELEARDEFDHCLMRVEANSLACAQAVHSVADNLAHVVHFALGFNLISIPPRESSVSFLTVKRLVAARPKYAAVLESLAELADDVSFGEMTAIVNHSKHRGIVEPRLSVEPPGAERPYHLEFGSFSCGGRDRAEQEVQQVLAPAYAAASSAVVNTGIAINALLSDAEAWI